MSLAPVLARHYINAPKPIPPRPNRSSTSSHSHTSLYSRDHLLALSPHSHSPNPHPAPHELHPPPPTGLVPSTASKIETVNRILRKDSDGFMNGLGPFGDQSPIHQNRNHSLGGGGGGMKARSQTMPVRVMLPLMRRVFPDGHQYEYGLDDGDGDGNEDGPKGKRRNNTLVEVNPGTEVMEGEYDPFNHGTKNILSTPKTGRTELGFEMDSPIDMTMSENDSDMDMEMDIEIELRSAKRFPPSPSRAQSRSIPNPRSGSLTPRAASSIFAQQSHQSGKYTPASPSPLSLSLNLAQAQVQAGVLSKKHDALRSIPRVETKNVTIVSSPVEDLPWRRPSAPASGTPSGHSPSPAGKSLNAFAPPFPLPPTSVEPQVPTPAAKAESATLPLPPPPGSLPPKPTSILPPVFVKRETAMLPQSMALPTIPPMGEGWEGDRSLSGNEKRRRASQTPTPTDSPCSSLNGSMGRMSIAPVGGRSAPSVRSGRPEKLVRLGEKLKENIRPL